jgi:hypothetical protein
MVRTQIQLTEEQARRLRRAARAQGVSLAEMVRRCIELALDETTEHTTRYARASSLIGKFRDPAGASDVARNHDEYLDEAFG